MGLWAVHLRVCSWGMRELGFQELFARNCSSRVVIWSWQLGDFEESYKSSFILHIYIYTHYNPSTKKPDFFLFQA